MKVKHFFMRDKFSEGEDAINEWLEKHPKIKIESHQLSIVEGENIPFKYTQIFYTENKNNALDDLE